MSETERGRAAPGRMDSAPGLCGSCAHARPIVSARGSTFWLCGLGATDARFPRDPRLPVVRCPGFLDGDGRGERSDDGRGGPA